MVSGLGSWSSHSIVFVSQPLCSHTACLEAQLLNIYSFDELPRRPDKILRVTCVEVSFYNGLSTYFRSDQWPFDATETRITLAGKMNNLACVQTLFM